MKISELIWKLQQLSFDKKEDSNVFINGQKIIYAGYNYSNDYYDIVTII